MAVEKQVAPARQSARSGQTRRHVLIDAWGSPADRLDDAEGIRALLERVVDILGATLLDLSLRRFSPQGVTAVAMPPNISRAAPSSTTPSMGWLPSEPVSPLMCARPSPPISSEANSSQVM